MRAPMPIPAVAIRGIARFVLAAGLLLPCANAPGNDTPHKPPNVLFIAVDDLRTELGCYGQTHMRTPHIDGMAARGVLFERAFCNIPVCGGSRSSLMSGLRPTPARFRTWNCSTEKDAPGIVTLNTHFKNNGYYTISNGKVFNNQGDCQIGWSEPDWRAGDIRYLLPENQRLHEERQERGGGRGPATEMSDAPIAAFRDGEVLEKTLRDLRRLAQQDQPFFLAAGFSKPHLPFVAPRTFWERYDRDRIQLPPTYRQPPENAPSDAIHSFAELRAYADIPARGPVSDEQARTLIHGYYACVSFVDHLIGELLNELDRLKLTDNTIVVLWGDHGWFLGDHTMWCKHSCFEETMRAPLIVAGPGIVRGGRARGLVEFVDIYPSLCDWAGLPAPGHLAGQSFLPLLQDPTRTGKVSVTGRYGNGETIRTDRHRFTAYRDQTRRVKARMLYDLEKDPLQTVNIAERPDIVPLANQLQTNVIQHIQGD